MLEISFAHMLRGKLRGDGWTYGRTDGWMIRVLRHLSTQITD